MVQEMSALEGNLPMDKNFTKEGLEEIVLPTMTHSDLQKIIIFGRIGLDWIILQNEERNRCS